MDTTLPFGALGHLKGNKIRKLQVTSLIDKPVSPGKVVDSWDPNTSKGSSSPIYPLPVVSQSDHFQ